VVIENMDIVDKTVKKAKNRTDEFMKVTGRLDVT
jgi:hypothetical protein